MGAGSPEVGQEGFHPLEVAFGVPLGVSGCDSLSGAVGPDPRRVLDELLVEALRRPPCLVAFSGGRDSSLLLAAAGALARREGLDLPVPVTARFPEVATTEETVWQEQLVQHVGLADWERVELTDQLDLLGPYARRLLLAHGNLFPFNAHFSAPLVERARGGTLVTGVGGDEVFGMLQWPRAARLADPAGPWPKRLGARLIDTAPLALRRWALRHHLDASRPWMTTLAADQAERRWADWVASQPVPRDRGIRQWLWPSRYWQLARHALGLVGELWGAQLLSPFMEPRFLQAAAQRMGPAGYRARADAIAGLLGTDLVPENLRHRRTKATFDLAFFGHYSRAFVEGWEGVGLDRQLVDTERLQGEWHRLPRPDARSYSLIKAAWLAAQH